MIEAAGSVWGQADVSHLYVIVFDSHIYIGENGRPASKSVGGSISR